MTAPARCDAQDVDLLIVGASPVGLYTRTTPECGA